jgi:hypothetical protein
MLAVTAKPFQQRTAGKRHHVPENKIANQKVTQE